MKTVPFRIMFVEVHRRMWRGMWYDRFSKTCTSMSICLVAMFIILWPELRMTPRAVLAGLVTLVMLLPVIYIPVIEEIKQEQRTHLPNEDDY